MRSKMWWGSSIVLLILTGSLFAQVESGAIENSSSNTIFVVIISILMLVIGLIIFFYLQKIKELKSYKSEINKLKQYQKSSDKLKSDFLTQISHEIRTPVNSILCFSSLIQQELENNLPEELKEGFGIIESGGRRLIRTIDLILNMSDVQAGNYEVNPSKFELEKDVISPITKEFNNIANSKGLNISNHNSLDGECLVECDRHMTAQILIHLIDNAIKYTEKGEVEVILYRDSEKRSCIDIHDTGIGMSSDFQKMLFSPFTQEDSGYTRKYEGNGLGLALVKKYCDLNKIDIDVKSKKWEGTTVTLKF